MNYKLVGIAKEDFYFINNENKEKLINISKKIISGADIEKVKRLFKIV